MKLLDDIPEGSLVALDTVIWIYAVESNPIFGPVVRPFFDERLTAGLNQAGSSLVALGELLVQPLSLGRGDLAARYRSFFTTTSVFSVWQVSREVVETAAELRARYRLKMLDALHVATAVVNRAHLFLSNDDTLRRVTEIKVLVLKSYTAPLPP